MAEHWFKNADQLFLVEVAAKTDVRGQKIFLATPYVILPHQLEQLANEKGDIVDDLPSSSEEGAVDRAVRFVESRFGPCQSATAPENWDRHVSSIARPRREP